MAILSQRGEGGGSGDDIVGAGAVEARLLLALVVVDEEGEWRKSVLLRVEESSGGRFSARRRWRSPRLAFP